LLLNFTKTYYMKLPYEVLSEVAGYGLSLLERVAWDFCEKPQALPAVYVISDAILLMLVSV